MEIREREKYMVCSCFFPAVYTWKSVHYLHHASLYVHQLFFISVTRTSNACLDRWHKPIIKLRPASNRIAFCNTFCKVLEHFWKYFLPSQGAERSLPAHSAPSHQQKAPYPTECGGSTVPERRGRAVQGRERGTSRDKEEAAAHPRGAERGISAGPSMAPALGYPVPIIRWLFAFVSTLKANGSSILPPSTFAF